MFVGGAAILVAIGGAFATPIVNLASPLLARRVGAIRVVEMKRLVRRQKLVEPRRRHLRAEQLTAMR